VQSGNFFLPARRFCNEPISSTTPPCQLAHSPSVCVGQLHRGGEAAGIQRHRIVSSFQQSADCFAWFSSKMSEETVPGEWASKLTELQRLVLVRCLPRQGQHCIIQDCCLQYGRQVRRDCAHRQRYMTAYLESSPSIPLMFILARRGCRTIECVAVAG